MAKPRAVRSSVRVDETAANLRERRSLLNSMATELQILWAGWVIAEDDDRVTKTLYVGPGTARRWKRLVERAGKVQEMKREGRNRR